MDKSNKASFSKTLTEIFVQKNKYSIWKMDCISVPLYGSWKRATNTWEMEEVGLQIVGVKKGFEYGGLNS